MTNPDNDNANLNGYVGFYACKRAEVYASTTLEASRLLVKALNVPPRKVHMLSTVLAEKNGAPVVHTHDF